MASARWLACATIMLACSQTAAAQMVPAELLRIPNGVFGPVFPAETGFNLGPSPLATGFFHPPTAPLLAPLATVDPRLPPEAPLVFARSLPWNEVLPSKTIIERANAYFAGLTALAADFEQTSGGRALTGTLYLQQPGRMRFDFNPPATVDVVADGKSVAIRDTRLGTQITYPIAQTPLRFLLGDGLTLGKDIAVVSAASERDFARITLRDRSALAGTTRIILFFDPTVHELRQWRIIDPQGSETVVVLKNPRLDQPIEPNLFDIPEARSR